MKYFLGAKLLKNHLYSNLKQSQLHALSWYK